MPVLLPYGALADAVLLLHAAIVVFIVLGLPLVVLGNRLGWRWVNRRGLRAVHLTAIGVVVLQAWLGRYCGLTVLESWLRGRTGQPGYDTGFIAHWLQRVLYHEAPLWLFALAYTGFGALVLWAWWRYPPDTHRPPGRRIGRGAPDPRGSGVRPSGRRPRA